VRLAARVWHQRPTDRAPMTGDRGSRSSVVGATRIGEWLLVRGLYWRLSDAN
jgi:hypothetical protein